MAQQADVHVISKANIAEHFVVSLPQTESGTVQDGHILVRTAIIGLAANNLSYAQLGSIRSWWDAYPVPSGLAESYSDTSQYGIGPAWGYGEVLESRVSGIETGMLLWGFWPTSNHPVDLQLVPADAPGHWIETSEHRKTLMNLYQRYILQDANARAESLDQSSIQSMAWRAACVPTWEAGYLLNKAVFGAAQIHPGGVEPWESRDADLSSAIAISLSASGKTARGFTDGLINNRSTNTGPLGLFAITSITRKDFIPKPSFSTKSVTYASVTDSDTLDWIAQLNPKKIVVADFGGRGDSLPKLLEALHDRFSGKVDVVVIGVGGNPQLHTPAELGRWAQRNAGLANRVQMNASGIRDALMKQDGAEKYFEDLNKAWDQFIKGESAKDLKLEIGTGVKGDDGLEGGWTRLCNGNIPGNGALAYRF